MHSLKTVLLIGFLANGLLLAACDSSATANVAPPDSENVKADRSKNTRAVGQFEYELRTEEASVLDDRFPFGYWEITRVYPEILSDSHPLVADAANQKIAALIDQYRCDGLGDQSFRTQEVFLGNGLLSIAYEAMWMCAAMQSPASESGSLNISLTNGTEVKLEDQFRGPSDYAQFRNQAIRKLNRELEDKVSDAGEGCPEVRAFNGFHTDGTNLIVSSRSDQQDSTACDVEVSFRLQSLEGKLRADSVLLAGAREGNAGQQ
ncbi:hypothetical protein ACFOZ5_03690 [Marinobacter lacisalsi]|uniref:Lipoprotein n=1 Tax=Marinobacter lacisalsi TaxID=475979 RepID=A0ABV8QF67_9GAMM